MPGPSGAVRLARRPLGRDPGKASDAASSQETGPVPARFESLEGGDGIHRRPAFPRGRRPASLPSSRAEGRSRLPRTPIPALAIPALALATCTAEPTDRASGLRFEDDTGREVVLPARPERIVSLAPSATSILVALGASDRIVARTGLDHEPELADRPVLGPTLTPSPERIVALRPDLIVIWPPAATPGSLDRLAGADVPVYRSDMETVDEITGAIARLGRLVGRSSRADSLVASIRSRIGAVRRRAACRAPRTVAYLVWHDPPYTVGSNTYVHEVIEAAGGRNAFADLDTPWAEVSEEALLARDPDHLVVPQGHDGDLPLAALRTRPFRNLSAVREGRIETVDSDRFNRPGPGIAEAVEELSAVLHPEPCR